MRADDMELQLSLYYILCSSVPFLATAGGLTVCPGAYLSLRDLPEFSTRNCNVIEGTLFLNTSNPPLNKSEVERYLTPLSSVVEITSTLLVERLEDGVDSIGQILPNLAVIRGIPLFRAALDHFVALRIGWNDYLKRLGLNHLTHILGKEVKVVFWKNKVLQYFETVNWLNITNAKDPKVDQHNSADKGTCDRQCTIPKCWGKSDCQIFPPKKPNCSFGVHAALRTSNDSDCLSFCQHPNGSKSCISCKNFDYKGRCVAKCLDNTFQNGGWRCVDRCPDITTNFPQSSKTPVPMFAFNGSCGIHCPNGYTENSQTGLCLLCTDKRACDIHCSGGKIQSLDDAKRFENCVVVEGALEIRSGGKVIDETQLQQYLGSIQTVNDYVVIEDSSLLSLNFLRNLTLIKGDHLFPAGDIEQPLHALVIQNNHRLRTCTWKKQKNLWLGGRPDTFVYIKSNPKLCPSNVAQLKEQFPSIVVDIQNGNETSLCNVTDYPTDKANRGDIVVIVVPLALAACLVVVGVLMCHYISKTRQKNYVPSWQLEANSQLYMNMEGQGQTPPIDDAWEINRSKIILEKELGKGTFGLVYSGIWHKDENTKPVNVAVKMLHKNASQQDRMSFLYEASVMKHFNSNQVVRLLGIVSRGNQALAVLELMTKGDLKSFLHSLRPEDEGPLTYKNFPLSENDVLQIAAQIATGMAYLTSLKFVHRDLAARNCMVTDNLTVKIGDFGLTRDVYESDYYRKIGQGPLPVRWMPPESLMDGKFDHASDVWSFGIVLWEVATLGIQPYPGMSNDQVCQFVMDGGVMKVGDLTHVPNLYVLLMKKCWLYKASNRPTFENIVEYLPDISAE